MNSSKLKFLIIATSTLMITVLNHVQAEIWSNGSGGNWEDTRNWTLGTVPDGIGANAIFGTLSTSAVGVNLGSSHTLGTLEFSGATNYLISSAPTAALYFDMPSGNATLTTSGSGQYALSVRSILNNDLVVNVDGLQPLRFISSIEGPGAFIKRGSGDLILTGNTTHTGGTFIEEGRLRTSTQSLSGNIVNNHTLEFLQLSNGTYAGNISGTGQLVKSLLGTLTLTGTNTYSGGTLINAGTLQIGDGGSSGSVVGNVVNNGTLRFQRLGVITLDGDISGNGELVIASGSVFLTGENKYTGGTRLISIPSITGRPTTSNLTIGNGGTTGSIVGDVVNNGGSFSFRRSDDITYDGIISGTGNFSQAGTGTLTLTGASTYTGNTIVNGGGSLILDGSLTSNINVLKSPLATQGSMIGGTGSTTGSLTVAAGSTVAPGTNGIGNLTVGDFNLLAGGVLAIDTIEGTNGSLKTDSLTVKGGANFGESRASAGAPFGPTVLDVKFDVNAPLPDLQGITILSADGGLKGRAPNVVLDPASLPNGQNFHLSLEATNLGGTFAGPGELIPSGAGAQGFVVLQIEKKDPVYVNPPNVTVINTPYRIPSKQPELAPAQVPTAIPSAIPALQPILVPALILGRGANLQSNVVATTTGQVSTPATGIRVQNGGVNLGGATLTPTPQTAAGNTVTPASIPIGTTSTVVVVDPPTNIAESTVMIVGSFGAVNQTNAIPGAQYSLIYKPNEVLTANRPADYGNLSLLGATQTHTQKQVGTAINQLLPLSHERPSNPQQALLVNQLYPLKLDQIPAALDSIAGVGTDPTFTTVLNGRIIQSAIDTRLQSYRDSQSIYYKAGRMTSPDSITNESGGTTSWGESIGVFGSGDYLQDADHDTYGFVLGVDNQVNDELVAGIALGYVRTSIEPTPGGSNDVKTLEAAGYTNWTDGKWFTSGLTGLGYHWLDMDRAVVVGGPAGKASSSPDAVGLFASVSAGRRFNTQFAIIEPSLGLRYDFVDRESFSESGSGFADRHVDSETLSSALVSAGTRAYQVYEFDDGFTLSPELRVGYAREIGDTDIDSRVSLINAPGSSFSVITEGPGDNVGIFGAQLTGTRGNTSFFIDYEGTIRSDYSGHKIRAGLSIAF